jgi:hypothetical protein
MEFRESSPQSTNGRDLPAVLFLHRRPYFISARPIIKHHPRPQPAERGILPNLLTLLTSPVLSDSLLTPIKKTSFSLTLDGSLIRVPRDLDCSP